MMERLLSNGVRTIVVETANRFARDLMVQEVGFAMLKARGMELIAADSPDAFLDDTPTATLVRYRPVRRARLAGQFFACFCCVLAQSSAWGQVLGFFGFGPS